MSNKHSFLFGILIVCLLFDGSLMLSAQQQKKEKAPAKKEEKIKIPPEALEPVTTKDAYEKRLKDAVALFDIQNVPATTEAYKKDASQPLNMGAIRAGIVAFQKLAMDPDIEEVMKYPRSWYAQMYNASLIANQLAKKLDSVIMSGKEDVYTKTVQQMGTVYDALKKLQDKPPKKLTEEQLKEIKKQNRERRKQHYIKWYKEQQAKQKELDKQMAAEGKKKDKKADNKKKNKKSSKEDSGD